MIHLMYNRLMNDITSSELWKKYNSIDHNIAKQIQNLGYLSKLIKMYLQGHYEFYGGFGEINNKDSFDSLVFSMLQFVIIYLNNQIKINCVKKISESELFNWWINHTLYKPGGIRYITIRSKYT